MPAIARSIEKHLAAQAIEAGCVEASPARARQEFRDLGDVSPVELFLGVEGVHEPVGERLFELMGQDREIAGECSG
ncbi:MAG: hypothetical protein PT977_13290 [Acidobacteriota bacterium]|nr:hypothetical protein [Acidobacteriota bacterium]